VALFGGQPSAPGPKLAWPVAAALLVATVAALVIGFAPQLVLHVAATP
jgi:NADH-quinone oxidoreductase subunit N